jgi:hypothetical protein
MGWITRRTSFLRGRRSSASFRLARLSHHPFPFGALNRWSIHRLIRRWCRRSIRRYGGDDAALDSEPEWAPASEPEWARVSAALEPVPEWARASAQVLVPESGPASERASEAESVLASESAWVQASARHDRSCRLPRPARSDAVKEAPVLRTLRSSEAVRMRWMRRSRRRTAAVQMRRPSPLRAVSSGARGSERRGHGGLRGESFSKVTPEVALTHLQLSDRRSNRKPRGRKVTCEMKNERRVYELAFSPVTAS